jgi:outer membrane protein
MQVKILILVSLASAVCQGQQEFDPRGPLKLSLKRAIEIGTAAEGNAAIQLADESVKQAQARSIQARSDLLPDVNGSIGSENMTRNLAAMGLSSSSLPRSTGAFNVFDARMTGSQTVLDLAAIRRLQASKATIAAEKSGRNATVDQAAGSIARAYMAALRADAQYEAVEANVALARALLKQAEQQNAAGTGTGVDVTRAQVELANELQRKIAAENDRTRAKLELLRSMGKSLDTEIELADSLILVPASPDPTQAIAQAMQQRSDWKAQFQKERAAGITTSAAKMDRMPSVSAFADYGSTGTGSDAAIPTRTYGVALKVPVLDGGRRKARVAESSSQHRQEQIRTRDLRDQIELEVRLALNALKSADEQVSVAKGGLSLAEKELQQARKRYEVGVANSVEVTDAQTRLARARDNQVQALYSHNLARIAFSEAAGTILEIGD